MSRWSLASAAVGHAKDGPALSPVPRGHQLLGPERRLLELGMVRTDHLILILAVLAIIFKSTLIALWSRRLYLRHGEDHSFFAIFLMLAYPKPREGVSDEMRKDLKSIQSLNSLTSFVFLAFAFAAFL
jgi:hypothetical protein